MNLSAQMPSCNRTIFRFPLYIQKSMLQRTLSFNEIDRTVVHRRLLPSSRKVSRTITIFYITLMLTLLGDLHVNGSFICQGLSATMLRLVHDYSDTRHWGTQSYPKQAWTVNTQVEVYDKQSQHLKITGITTSSGSRYQTEPTSQDNRLRINRFIK
ncbi:hypothetical protein J3R30DRAFT_324996 [Lentinula aciculospora]|uniref:Uncharacterized protein n=1 Tax=Lentinula aciculospora TaxID=153920 RepID=A0A9W9A888_9AGAR|nr:hypothetical protein J3R30DRAFT_324996 [Lentinula aciculospora]